MFCEKCGNKIREGERFCSACGNRIERKTSESNQDPMKGMGYGYRQGASGSPKPRSTGEYEKRPKKKYNEDKDWEKEDRKEIIAFVILGLFIIALVVFIVVGVIKLAGTKGDGAGKHVQQLTEQQKNELSHGNEVREADKASENEKTVLPDAQATPAPADIENETALLSDDDLQETDDQKTETKDEEDDEFIISDSSTRYLTNADLVVLSEWEIRIARNEIFARHGRVFKSKDLAEYFREKKWYKGTVAPELFDDSMLNAIELENLKFITNYEKSHGLNQ